MERLLSCRSFTSTRRCCGRIAACRPATSAPTSTNSLTVPNSEYIRRKKMDQLTNVCRCSQFSRSSAHCEAERLHAHRTGHPSVSCAHVRHLWDALSSGQSQLSVRWIQYSLTTILPVFESPPLSKKMASRSGSLDLIVMVSFCCAACLMWEVSVTSGASGFSVSTTWRPLSSWQLALPITWSCARIPVRTDSENRSICSSRFGTIAGWEPFRWSCSSTSR